MGGLTSGGIGGFFQNLGGGVKDWLLGEKAPAINPDDPRYQLQHGGLMSTFASGRLGQGGQAPTVNGANIATGPQNQFRTQELGLAQQLQRVGSGQEMGAGELATRRQVGQALAGIQSGQRMARGGNAAIGARAAARAAGDLGVNAAGMSREAALQDQTAARGLLAGVLGQGRGADIGLATSQAGLNQQANLANQQANLQQQGLNNQMDLGLLSQLLGMDQATLQAQLALQGMQQQYGNRPGALGDILGVGGQIGAAAASNPAIWSDEKLKENVTDGEAAVREFLGALRPKTFDYKDPKHGGKRVTGVMAQDAERSKLGKAIVKDTPEGKQLDSNRVASALLASVAVLDRRLAKLEPKRKKAA